MGKLGIHGKITAKLYDEIKADCKGPADDCCVMEKYNIGATTAGLIRRTKNYQQYRQKSSTARKRNRERLEAIMAANPIPAERPYQKSLVDRKMSQLPLLAIVVVFMLVVVTLILILINK